MSTKIVLITVVAILLKIALAFSTFHPDIRAFQIGGDLVAKGNILNLYDYLSTLPSDNQLIKVFGSNLLIYPPLIYLFHGFFNFLFAHLLGMNFINNFVIEQTSDFGNIYFNLKMLFLKLPYLAFDLAGAYVIYKLFSNQKQKILALIFWLFNPVSLYTTYMMGQFDLVPAFFTLLAVLFIKQKRYLLSALALGFGAAFKLYPLLLLIPLLIYLPDWRERVKAFFIGIAPYSLSLLFYIPSSGFRNSALVAGQTMQSFPAVIAISTGEKIILYPLFILFFYLLFIYEKKLIPALWRKFFIIMLLFFVFTHYHPQWFVWLTPFLILDLIASKLKNWILVGISLFSFFSLLFFFDASLTLAIFAPIYPDLYSITNVWKYWGININDVLARSLLQTIFVSAALIYFIQNFRNQEENI